MISTDPSTAVCERPRLPRSAGEWTRVFGPGAIIASLTIGTGELIFSTRGGVLFGYHVLFLFALISFLKWVLVISTSRHMVLTGVHPYERMLDLPGPRGWLPITLLIMSTVAMPIWLSFHAGVLGNLTSWVTGTRTGFNGGMDYLWGLGMLLSVLVLSATGGYAVLERVQMAVVAALVICAGLTLVLYRPDWVELLLGVVPQRLSYPGWLPEKYPEIARDSVWVEATRYVGVIGGAGFDYLAYTSWLREKSWGVLPGRATPEQLEAIAADPHHEVRQWIRAPLVDCAISFALIVAFSAVFVASGAMILRPAEVVPDENNLLNLQARFVTQIHPLLLPLYITGAFLTMLGTLYGTFEIVCCIADEIVRSFVPGWNAVQSARLKRVVLGWCAPVAIGILVWLFVRQARPDVATDPSSASAVRVVDAATPAWSNSRGVLTTSEPAQRAKPKILLDLLTPVNLFTGVLACGMICFLSIWMDRRYLPAALQPPLWLTGLNIMGGVVFFALGIKGYWDNPNRTFVLCSMAGLFAASMIISIVAGARRPEVKFTRATAEEGGA